MNKIAKEQNDKDLEAVKKSGKTAVYVPTKEERMAFKKVLVMSRNDDLVVQAGKNVHLNPFQMEEDPREAHVSEAYHPKGDTCDECGAVLVQDEKTGGYLCRKLAERRKNLARAQAATPPKKPTGQAVIGYYEIDLLPSEPVEVEITFTLSSSAAGV